MNNPRAFIILLWGAPAAGKSTLANALVSEYLRRTGLVLPHLGTDRLNQSIMGEQFEGAIRPHLYQCLANLCEGLLQAGRPVLLEGTFLEPERRRQVEQLAAKWNVRCVSAQVECRLALREARNERRNEGAYVPDEFLRRAHELAKNQIPQADFVFDTELQGSGGLARFLMGAVGVGQISA